MRFLTIPASWLDSRIRNNGMRLVADEAFERVIFPAFACQLEDRALDLVSTEVVVQADELTNDRE